MFSKKSLFVIGVALTVVLLFGVISNATTTLTSIEPILSYDETTSTESETTSEAAPSNALSASTTNKEIPNGIQITEGADSQITDILTASQEVSGANNENTTVETVPRGEETDEFDVGNIEDDIYSIGQDEVIVDKYVNGNVYIIAKNVTINSTVNGNVYVIAENINNNGSIIGSTYEIASNITFGDNITINKTAYLLSEHCTMPKDATFSQDIKILSSDVNFNSSVFRNMYVYAENIIMGADSYIKEGGNIIYSDTIQDSSGDYTDIIKKAENVTEETVNATIDFTTSIVFRILRYVSTLVLIIFIIAVIRRYNLSYDTEGKRQEVKAGISGLLHLVLMPILAILLMISFIGMPVGIVALLSWLVISIILSKPVVSIYIAKLICKNRGWNYDGYVKMSLISIVVYLIIDLLTLIPVVGGIIQVICTVYGYGIVVSAIRSKRVKCCCKKCENDEKVEEKVDG